jgi:hypothetical protein
MIEAEVMMHSTFAIVLLMAFAAVVSSCASVDSTTTQYDLAMYLEDMLLWRTIADATACL